MFGCLDLFAKFLLIFLLPLSTWAVKARVVNDGAIVYKKADFDSDPYAYLQAGKVFEVSTKKIAGAFHQIRIGKGKTGFIADTDIQFLKSGQEKKSSQANPQINPKSAQQAKRQKKSFSFSRYRGLNLTQIEYREDTMGSILKDSMLFYGATFSGTDLMIEGDVPMQIDFIFHSGAPGYYKDRTKKTANGFIFLADVMFVTPQAMTKDLFYFFGFGPMFKFSKIDVQLEDTYYSLEDMNLGAVFNFGFSARWNRYALRPEYRYYWEKMQYSAFGLSFQFDF